MEDRLPRKLAAILYADVAGYSRLTGEDEEGTHRRLSEYLGLISDAIEERQGRVVHYAGDAVLADFGTVTEALSCATFVQRELKSRNRDLPEERKVRFRIGVNLGEVIIDRDDIYGDGVNVAARLESLAEAGGICISESVRTAAGKKLDLDYEFMGEQNVKNIEEPLRAYRVVTEREEGSKVASTETHALELPPDKPSIAVLSFENMSGDPDQEYFADGIAEDIITALSKLSQLLVIARNSSFTYKGRAVKVQEIAAELGVAYVLEGSVRKVGNRARITSQLIDCKSGGHLWAEKFDRDLTDIFEVQDEVTQAIVSAIALGLTADDRERLASTGTESLEAYDCFLRGREEYRFLSKEGSAQAETMFSRAISLDPGYATAFAYMAYTYLTYHVNRWKCAAGDPLEHAHSLARKALELDATDPHSHLSLGKTWMWKRRHDEAIVEHERTIALDPNFAVAYAGLGLTLDFAGRSEEAIELIHRGMRLDPHYPVVRLLWLAQPNFQLTNYDEAILLLERHLSQKPDSLISRALLAASYGHTGRTEDARTVWQNASQIDVEMSLDTLRYLLPYKDAAAFEKIVEGLEKADIV